MMAKLEPYLFSLSRVLIPIPYYFGHVPSLSPQNSAIAENRVVVFSKTYCPYCVRAKKALAEAGIQFVLFELDIGEGEKKDE